MKETGITRYEQIYEVVRKVPFGKVATYGQIARIVSRCTARMVGYAMASLPYGTGVPWQRIINHKGEISPRSRGDGAIRQRRLLQAEGVRFDRRGRIDLKKYRWTPPFSFSLLLEIGRANKKRNSPQSAQRTQRNILLKDQKK